MKLTNIFALFTLSVMVRGWVAFLQPIALSIGAAFTALNFDFEPILDMHSIKWLNEKTETTEDKKADKKEEPDLPPEPEIKDFGNEPTDLKEFVGEKAYEKIKEKGWDKPDWDLSWQDQLDKHTYIAKVRGYKDGYKPVTTEAPEIWRDKKEDKTKKA